MYRILTFAGTLVLVMLAFAVGSNWNPRLNAQTEPPLATQVIKDVHPTTSCTTTGSFGHCTITVTWPGTAFSDTNYTVVCTPGAFNWLLYVTNKTTTTANVNAQSFYGSQATFDSANCVAVHD